MPEKIVAKDQCGPITYHDEWNTLGAQVDPVDCLARIAAEPVDG